MFEREKDRLRQQAGEDRFLKMMAMQTIDIMERCKSSGSVMQEKKTLSELKKMFDKHASDNKQGMQSVITPDEAEKMICEYFGLQMGKPTGKVDILDLL